MKKQIVIIGIIAILVCVVFSGCTENNNNANNNNTSNTTNNNNTTIPNNNPSQFVGDWELRVLGSTFPWSFHNDSTLWIASSNGTMYNTGTWAVNNNRLWLYNNTVCYMYVLSDNGNTLTLNITGDDYGHLRNIILIKEGTQTSFIMNLYSDTNKIIVVTVDPITKYKWSDIDIHFIEPLARYQVFYANDTPIDTVNQTSGAGGTAVSVGDYILISPLSYTGNLTIYLRYKPTNTILGTYTIPV